MKKDSYCTCRGTCQFIKKKTYSTDFLLRMYLHKEDYQEYQQFYDEQKGYNYPPLHRALLFNQIPSDNEILIRFMKQLFEKEKN